MKGGAPPVCCAIIYVTMDGFADIPAVNDAYAFEEEKKCEKNENKLKKRRKNERYRFNEKNIYVI